MAKPQVKCGECPNQAFVALSDHVIASAICAGPIQADLAAGGFCGWGVSHPLVDETSWFLAVQQDFDGRRDWSADALAYMETCR